MTSSRITNSFTFSAVGIPRPQGSKDQFGAEASPYVKPWRYDIRNACIDAKPDWWIAGKDQRIGLSVVFRFKRPKKHYHLNGELRDDAPYYVVARKGDIDKLSRALCDALTSVAYDDDDQVVNLTAAKRYCTEEEHPGLTVTLIKLPT